MPDESLANGRAAGGQARAKSLSPKRRQEIARRGARARWEVVPEAVCGSADSPLVIGNTSIECYVLENGQRVISQRSFLRALGRSVSARRTNPEGGPAALLVQGKAIAPYIPEGLLERANPIHFKLPTGQKAYGYDAELLPDVCETYLAARRAGALPSNQAHIAEQAEILVRGLARVGIIALVDEATGYQEYRTRDALARILEQFIDRELQAYVRTFPPDYYKELFRLRGLPYSADTVKRPQYFGKLTNDIVYKRLAPGVLDELKKVQEKSEAGYPKHKLFQRLTANVGYPKLREHLGSVVTLMKLSDDYGDFKSKLDRMHPRFDEQPALDLDWGD